MPDVDIELVKPSPYQPRLAFDLEELRGSIIKDGILTPLTVRQKDNYYELIDGERRLRLAKELGYKTVPLSIIEANDETADRMVWKVNTLRKDYAPKEKALHYQMHQLQGMSLRGIAGDHDDEIHNVLSFLNVLKLPERYRDEVWDGCLSVGHVRELEFQFNQGVAIATPLSNLDIAIERKLNVRQFHDYLHPQRARTEAQRVEAAQKEAEKLIPEVEAKMETPEDYVRAAEALSREAKRRAEEAMTPEQKAEEERKKLVAEARRSLHSTSKKIEHASQVMDVSEFRELLTRIEETLETGPGEAKAQLIALGEEVAEAENKAKAEAKAKQEEEKRQQKAEEERRREERADKKAREKYKGDKVFVKESLKAMSEQERVEMLDMVPIPDKGKKVKSVKQEFDEIMKTANNLADKLDKLKKGDKLDKVNLQEFSITLRILADYFDEFAKLAER